MTLDEQISWLADEAAKRLASAGRRDESAATHRASVPPGIRYSWHNDRAADKERQGKKLREGAAALLAVENSLRAYRAALEAA